MDPASAYHTFYTCLMVTSHEEFRLSSHNPSQKREPGRPWFTEEALTVVQNARNAFYAWRVDPLSESARMDWSKAEAIKKRTLRRLKRQSWDSFVTNLEPRGANPKTWQFIKAMKGKGNEPPIDGTDIETEGGIISQPSEKAAAFLEQFDVSSKLGSANARISHPVACAMASQAPCSLNTPLQQSELDHSLNCLKDTAMGADKVHNKMLKNLDANNRSFLLHVFNRIHATGYVPKSWKEAVVIPLIKPGKPRKKKCSYRPISLTPCPCKAYERVINARLSWMLESKNLLPKSQSGFRAGRSTLDNIIALEQRIRRGWSERKKTYAIFLDMKKAFDLVWIPGLLKKLAQNRRDWGHSNLVKKLSYRSNVSSQDRQHSF